MTAFIHWWYCACHIETRQIGREQISAGDACILYSLHFVIKDFFILLGTIYLVFQIIIIYKFIKMTRKRAIPLPDVTNIISNVVEVRIGLDAGKGKIGGVGSNLE